MGVAILSLPQKEWVVQSLYLNGPFVERAHTLSAWAKANCFDVTHVGIETLVGGDQFTQQKLAGTHAIVAAQLPRHLTIAAIQPSTHFHFTSGVGKYNEKYRKTLEDIVGKGTMTLHELTAVSCAMMMLAYAKGSLSQFYQSRIKWLT